MLNPRDVLSFFAFIIQQRENLKSQNSCSFSLVPVSVRMIISECLALTLRDETQNLSGMFRRSASLAIPHLKSFATIPSVSLVQLGHKNRNVFLSHESQREIGLV